MRARPSFLKLVAAELTRCRCRPVVGRLPLLAVAGVFLAASGSLLLGAAVTSPEQLGDVTSIVAPLATIVALVVGAATVQDLLTSGAASTDRLLVGRPAACTTAAILAVAAWSTVVGVAISVGLAGGFLAGAVAPGPSPSAGGSLSAWWGPAARLSVGAGIAGSVGASVVWLTRSATATVGGFLGLVLAGDALLVTLLPPVAPLLLPDTVFALASGHVAGLNVGRLGLGGASVAAVVGAVAVAAAAAVQAPRRDLP